MALADGLRCEVDVLVVGGLLPVKHNTPSDQPLASLLLRLLLRGHLLWRGLGDLALAIVLLGAAGSRTSFALLLCLAHNFISIIKFVSINLSNLIFTK